MIVEISLGIPPAGTSKRSRLTAATENDVAESTTWTPLSNRASEQQARRNDTELRTCVPAAKVRAQKSRQNLYALISSKFTAGVVSNKAPAAAKLITEEPLRRPGAVEEERCPGTGELAHQAFRGLVRIARAIAVARRA